MAENEPYALIVRGVEAVEGLKAQHAAALGELTTLRGDVAGMARDRATIDATHATGLAAVCTALEAVQLELRRREDRLSKREAQEELTKATAVTGVVNAARALWADATFRALLFAAVAGWLGLSAGLVQWKGAP
jgi:hypothetical protein